MRLFRSISPALVLMLAGCAAIPSGQDHRMEVIRLEAHAMHAYHGDESAEALELYRRIVELDPERTQAWFRIGNLEAEAGRLEEAITAYEQALESDPGHARARHNLGLAHIRHGADTLEQARETLAEEEPEAVYRADRFLAHLMVGLVRSVDIAIDCEDGAAPTDD